MKRIKKYLKDLTDYFTATEILLWSISFFLILISFIIFDRNNHITLISSVIGITSIIFNAKGNPFGQLLMIVFSLLYGYISFSFSYYGEMITYLGMTMPMAAFALITWLKHPYKGKRSEVKIHSINKKEIMIMIISTLAVTMIFYHILKFFYTSNLIPSTISVTTSFIAVYLTYKRSPFFSIAYALNDIVLIILWILASTQNTKYISVVICFTAFLIVDIYGFINWKKMERKQKLFTD